MGVDGFPGDQQLHDLTGAFEDPIDAQVAQHLLGRDGPFATVGQRLGCLVATATADLHHLVGDEPRHLARVQLGERGLDPDVLAALVGHHRRQFDDRLHRECRRGDERDLLGNRLVPPDGLTPLDPLGGPLTGDPQRVFGGAGADRGQRQTAGVEGGQGNLEPLALPAEPVLGRYPYPIEVSDTVLDTA